MTKQRSRSFLSFSLVALTGLVASTAANAISDAEMEAEAAKEFARLKASAPLTTDQDTIDYIACVANAVVLSL